MTKSSGIGWRERALADPELTDRNFHLIMLGPVTIGEACTLLGLKIKYKIRGIRES